MNDLFLQAKELADDVGMPESELQEKWHKALAEFKNRSWDFFYLAGVYPDLDRVELKHEIEKF